MSLAESGLSLKASVRNCQMPDVDMELLEEFISVVKRFKKNNPESKKLRISQGAWEALGKPDIIGGVRIMPDSPAHQTEERVECPIRS